jgi:hypothetical protein
VHRKSKEREKLQALSVDKIIILKSKVRKQNELGAGIIWLVMGRRIRLL